VCEMFGACAGGFAECATSSASKFTVCSSGAANLAAANATEDVWICDVVNKQYNAVPGASGLLCACAWLPVLH